MCYRYFSQFFLDFLASSQFISIFFHLSLYLIKIMQFHHICIGWNYFRVLYLLTSANYAQKNLQNFNVYYNCYNIISLRTKRALK